MSESVRRVGLVVLIIGGLISAAGCGNPAKASDPVITIGDARQPFLARGFVVGCPNIAVGALPSFGIATRGADPCPPNLGGVTVYRTAAAAKKSCAPNAKYFCVGPVYAVRNLVLGIEPRDSARIRRELLKAFRTFGTPARIA